jgi:hypothetical protein
MGLKKQKKRVGFAHNVGRSPTLIIATKIRARSAHNSICFSSPERRRVAQAGQG